MGDDNIWLNPPEYFRPHLKKFKLGHRSNRKNGKLPDDDRNILVDVTST
jgi:hypothetical protein